MPLWLRVTSEDRTTLRLYGYRKVLTPVFEDTALFARTAGEGSDVVQKEMYSFRGPLGPPADIAARGDGADLSRLCRAQGCAATRTGEAVHDCADVPLRHAGKGRYREHWQASVEAIGSDDPAIDAELVQLYDTLLHRLGVSAYHLELNSIGCHACRPAYLATLRLWLEANEHRLDADTRAKIGTSPLRVFDNYLAKPETVRTALDEAPKIGESLCEECVAHFAAVRADLDATGVAYTLVPTLVRGLDYYTRTTWEFIGPMDNENSTISGGGRYDGLVEEIGGPPTPASDSVPVSNAC